jgi:urease accessory protein
MVMARTITPTTITTGITTTAITITAVATITIITTSIATTITTITITPMLMTTSEPVAADAHVQMTADEAAALYRLMTWLSPSFPVGAFSYSSGIEWAVEAGDIRDAESLRRWLAMTVGEGGGFCDAVLFAHAWRAVAAGDDGMFAAVAELALAFAPSKERFLETTAQGRAFLDTTRAAWPCAALETLPMAGTIALPVAVAAACAGHGIALESALHAYLHGSGANLISAGVRLVPLGQTDGQRVLAALEPVIAATASRAMSASLDDLGSAAFRADLASMRHEGQYTRLFRS